MAVTFRSKATAVGGTGTSPTAAEPAGAVAGDLLVAIFEADLLSAITPPAGWSNLVSVSPSNVTFRVDYILRGASAPSLVWTFTGSVYRELHVLAFQTSGGTIRLCSQSTVTSGNSAATTIDPPPTTATASSSLALAFAADGAFTAPAAPAGYTLRSTAAFDCCIADKTISAPGVEDPSTFSGFGGGTADWFGMTATITDIPATLVRSYIRPFPFKPGSPRSSSSPYR